MSEESFKLTLEGGLKVLYKGTWVSEILFDVDQMTIGVLDPENNIYPDINLRQYRLEGEDPYISRRHARFFRSEGQYYIEDICRNNSTSINTKGEIINGQKRELTPGTRIFISESLVFCFEHATPNSSIATSQKDDNSSQKANVQISPVGEGQTQALSSDMKPSEAQTQALSSDMKPGEGQVQFDETKSSEGQTQPSETKPSEGQTQPSETKPSEGQTQPSETKPSEGQTQPSEAKPSETKPSESEATVNSNELKEVEDIIIPTNPPDQSQAHWYLDIESQRPVFFKPKNTFTSTIELNPEEWIVDADGKKSLHIGRHSTDDQIYPEIDLWKFYFNDGDEYIARRHARIFESDGKLYFQDISGKGSTWHTQKDDEHRLLHTSQDEAKVEVTDKLKIFISDSVTFTARK